jgi:TPR repeat protein
MKYPLLRWVCQSVSVVVFLAVVISSAAANSFDTASQAYSEGDFKKAAKIFSSLAGQGDASAQFYLGDMYLNGKGVPQDHSEAARWYRLAAEQGLAVAQYKLGYMYAEGKGISQSYEDAYAWWIVAAMNGVEDALKNIESRPKQFTPFEVEKIGQHVKLIWARTTLIAQR